MVAAGAIRHRHLPNDGIQWLQVKPWMCLIGQCTPRCTAASTWSLKQPVISLYFLQSSNLLSPINIAKDHVMVVIN
jgi:hypothetical protein